jgi:NAD(P)-dependent dehydrogenase (short-subunit alcohol dehydrogenase family)
MAPGNTNVAIVTGGATGIGAAIAERFAQGGYEVVLFGRRLDRLQQQVDRIAATGGIAWCCQGDVSVEADVARLVDTVVARSGRIVVLANSAGVAQSKPFIEMTAADWDATLDVNLRGAFLATRHVALQQRKQSGGSIVHVASIDSFGAEIGYSSYHVSKAGLMGLVRGAALELASFGIRVNAVNPGYVHTEMVPKPPKLRAYLEENFERVPMRRVVTGREVADAVFFLASDAASGITGTGLTVDGGLLANLYVLETMPELDEAS